MSKSSVRNIMKKSFKIISCNLAIKDAINIITDKKIRNIVVSDLDGYIYGELKYTKNLELLIKKLCSEGYGENIKISDFANKKIITSHPDDNISTVFEKMNVTRTEEMLIADRNKAVGIVSIYDIFDVMTEQNIKFANKPLKNIKKENNNISKELEKDILIEQLNKEIKFLKAKSTIDYLTGLYNVRYFKTRINEELERSKRYNDTISIIFIDIDNFKNINDTYGHECGNSVLHSLGEILKNKNRILRISDIAVRYGGEEFIIICPSSNKEQAAIIAERIRKVIEKTKFEYMNQKVKITVSIGVSEFTGKSDNIMDTVKEADLAMYKAKSNGKNSVVVHR